MSVGAICFTISGNNGNCWVVLVILVNNFFSPDRNFFLICGLHQRDLHAHHLHLKSFG